MSNNQLALLGGTPLRTEPLPPYNTIEQAEKDEVMKVLEGGELSGFIAYAGDEFYGGQQVQALEEQFKEFFGVKHAIAVNSATSGLHAALAATGIGPGDEVIVPPYTMSASATAVLFTGAVPIFADIENETYCIDPAEIEKNITPQTKGIVAVNLFGHPADLDTIRALADKHDLFVLEDNAQSPAGKYKGRYTGTIGDFGVFSFNRHKTMQSGEGGVVICDDDQMAQKVRLVRNHGEVVVGSMGFTDIQNTVGLNYRMTEMEAAVARHQFAKIDDLNAQRIALADHITEGLQDIEGISAPITKDDCKHVYYFYVMHYDEDKVGIPRQLFLEAVNAEGVPLRGGYVQPVYMEPVYQQKLCFGKDGFPFTANPRNEEIRYEKGLCPVVENLYEKTLLLTHFIYPPLTNDDMDVFVAALKKVIANKDELLAHAAKAQAA